MKTCKKRTNECHLNMQILGTFRARKWCSQDWRRQMNEHISSSTSRSNPPSPSRHLDCCPCNLIRVDRFVSFLPSPFLYHQSIIQLQTRYLLSFILTSCHSFKSLHFFIPFQSSSYDFPILQLAIRNSLRIYPNNF